MGAGAVAGGTMRSISMRVPRTISRRTTTIIPRNTRTRIRTGSTTRNTAGMPSTRISQRLRSMGSRVREPGAGRPHPTHGVTAKVQVTKAVEGLKQATPVVAEVARAPWGVLEKGETSALPVIRARRAGALPRAALPVRGGRGAAAAVVEEPPGAAAGVVGEVAVANCDPTTPFGLRRAS